MNKETKTPKLPKPIAQKPKVQENLPVSINKDGTPGKSYNKGVKRVSQSPNILAEGLGESSIAATATITGDAKIANKGDKTSKDEENRKMGIYVPYSASHPPLQSKPAQGKPKSNSANQVKPTSSTKQGGSSKVS